MSKRIIEISVNDEYVLGSGVVVGAAGSHDDVVLHAAFGEMWSGLNIYATFRNALGEEPTVILLLPSMLADGETMKYKIDVPSAAKRYDGRMTVTFTGFAVTDGAEEETATNTSVAFFRVLPSDFALADDGSIDATLAQQLQQEINKLSEYVGDLIPELCGISGSVVISAADWSGLSVSIKISDVGEKDAIIFTHATQNDLTALNAAGIFIDPVVTDGVVKLTATENPKSDITLIYFVLRGI